MDEKKLVMLPAATKIKKKKKNQEKHSNAR